LWVDHPYMLPLFYTTLLAKAVSRRNQNEVRSETFTHEVPAWVRDNLVLKLLDDKGFRVEIMYDRKYLNGLCNKPLVVIKSKNRIR
jgi:hypothetical protein